MIINTPVDRNNDINTLQEGVDTIKNDGHPNLIWDISDNLYSESRDVSTLPRDITNGYVVKLNDIFYMLGGGNATTSTTSTSSNYDRLSSYKYVDSEWVEDSVLGIMAMYRDTKYYPLRTGWGNNGGVVSNNKKLCYLQYNSSNNHYTSVYSYNGTSNPTTSTYYWGKDSSDRAYWKSCALPSTGSLKTIGSWLSNGTINLTIGSTSSSSIKTLGSPFYVSGGNSNKDTINTLSQGVCYGNYFIFLVNRVDDYRDDSSSDQNSLDYKYY